MMLGFCDKFCTFPTPLFVDRLDVCDTDVQEARELFGVLWCPERHVWLIIGWTTAYVQNEPGIGNAKNGGFTVEDNVTSKNA